MTELERQNLVMRLGRGDADALEALLKDYHGILLKLVAQQLSAEVRRRVEPEDVLQDAYVSAFDGLRPAPADPAAALDAGADASAAPKFAAPAAFYAWLEQIVRNKVRDIERGARRQKRDVAREGGAALLRARRDLDTSCGDLMARLTGSGTSPSGIASRQEAVGALLVALARLPELQRSVIRLRFLQNVAMADVATLLDVGESEAYAASSRGLKALREMLLRG